LTNILIYDNIIIYSLVLLEITVPRDSSLQFRLVVGTNPETGAPIINSKTFAKIKSAALDQDVYDTATALEGLQM
jgi:hypothetical protein